MHGRLLLVMGAGRFARTPDGRVWHGATYNYQFWQRYLAVFDELVVASRVAEVAEVAPDMVRSDGDGVSFHALPDYRGALGWVLTRGRYRRRLIEAPAPDDAVIVRVPSVAGAILTPIFRRHARPYGVEVVGDPLDVWAPGATRHPLSPILRLTSPRALRVQVAGAAAACYVTRSTLQARYPCPGYCVGVSDVILPAEAFVPESKVRSEESLRRRIIMVGQLAQLYKAPHILIEAVARGCAGGGNWELVIVGDGKYRGYLEALPAAKALGERLTFTGRLPIGEPVRAQLDQSDLFVLPSLTEGLPRAMVEAMARGLPCIGSTAGGIPELLEPEDLVPPGDANALLRKIREMLDDPERLARAAARNLAVAAEYRDDVLQARRVGFYRHLRNCTESYLRGGTGP